MVPKYTDNIQKDYNWINDILKYTPIKVMKIYVKDDVFRSDNDFSHYIDILKILIFQN